MKKWMLGTDGKNNKQETAGGHWRNSALLTKDRERIQTSEREWESQREREIERSLNNRKWLLFVLTVHTTVRAGKQEKERPLQSQRSTAGVAVGLVNSSSLLCAYSSSRYTKKHAHTHQHGLTGFINLNSALLSFSLNVFLGLWFLSRDCKCFFKSHHGENNASLHSLLNLLKPKQSCNEYDLAN